MALTEKELYEAGSKSCQVYSDLTMRIRTLAQQVIIAYAVGIGLLANRSLDAPLLFGVAAVLSGAVVWQFGRVLHRLNRHYSEAFEAIRHKSLVLLEHKVLGEEGAFCGPWQAHKDHRQNTKSEKTKAWDGPFDTLRVIGIAGCVLGVAAITASAVMVFLK